MGKLNEIQKQMTQSYGDNAFTTTIKDDTVEFDSLKDKFTFKDEVEVPSLKVNGETVSSQVQADWNQSDDTKADYIKNKPTIPSTQVQSDWNQNDSEAADFIKNRICYDERKFILYLETQIDEYGYINDTFDALKSISEGTYKIIIGNNEEIVDITLSSYGSTISGSFKLAQGTGSVTYTPEEQGYGTIYVYAYTSETFYKNKSFKLCTFDGSLVTIDNKYLGFYITSGTGNGSIIENSFANIASGQYSHAEGALNKASGQYSHAEGEANTASGKYSHAEGSSTIASGEYSHAEGCQSVASNQYSHAEGIAVTASGGASHAEGSATIAKYRSQHVFGEYNVIDPASSSPLSRGNYVEIVGNGKSNVARSNARTLDWNGNEMLAGTLTIGGGSGATIKVESGALKVSFDGGTTWLTISAS